MYEDDVSFTLPPPLKEYVNFNIHWNPEDLLWVSMSLMPKVRFLVKQDSTSLIKKHIKLNKTHKYKN